MAGGTHVTLRGGVRSTLECVQPAAAFGHGSLLPVLNSSTLHTLRCEPSGPARSRLRIRKRQQGCAHSKVLARLHSMLAAPQGDQLSNLWALPETQDLLFSCCDRL